MLVSLLRTVLMYGVILLAVRLLGKRQISQLQASELVATLLLSELAVLPIQEEGLPLWRGLLPMGALVLCELGASWGMLKSGRFRKLVCGSPMVVIQRGKVLQGQMRRLRMTTEDLFEQLRQNNVFYLEDVAWAIIETNGRMSVIRRPEEDPVTPKQLGLKVPFPGLEVAVISDGEPLPPVLGPVRQRGGLGPPPAGGAGPFGAPGVPDDRAHRRQVPHPPQGAPGMKQARGKVPRGPLPACGGRASAGLLHSFADVFGHLFLAHAQGDGQLPVEEVLRLFAVALVHLAHFAALFLGLLALAADAFNQADEAAALVALQGRLIVDPQGGGVALGADLRPDGGDLMDQLLGLFPGHGRAHKHAAVHRGVDSLRFKQGLQGVILPVGVRGPALQGPHLDHAAHAAAAIDHKLSWLKHFRYLLVPWGAACRAAMAEARLRAPPLAPSSNFSLIG